MTGPFTFLSSELYRTNDDPNDVRANCADRVAEEVALGSCSEVSWQI